MRGPQIWDITEVKGPQFRDITEVWESEVTSIQGYNRSGGSEGTSNQGYNTSGEVMGPQIRI